LQGIENSRRVGDRDYRLDSVEVHGNRAAAAFSWTSADGERVRWAQALILRDGRIVRMQDFADPDKALRAIRR
jgi:ketosteroid isomerase-like protein